MTLLADALRLNDRYAESAQVLDKLITDAGPKATWSLYYMRGVALDQAGDATGAERDLQQALTLSPDEPEVLNYLGYTWIDKGQDLVKAKAMIERAVAAKPDSERHRRFPGLGLLPPRPVSAGRRTAGAGDRT